MLIQRPNSPYWYAYMWQDGKFKGVSLRTESKKEAKALHEEIKERYRKRKREEAIARMLGEPVRKRKPLSVGEIQKKYCQINPRFSLSGMKIFNAFREWLNSDNKDISEIDTDTAIRFIDTYKENSPKWQNNVKSALSQIWKTLKPYSDIGKNIWLEIPNKSIADDTLHFRLFTENEANAIIGAAPSPWKEACIIAYYTGLRRKDVFTLAWSDIRNGSICLVPAKTRHTGKAVWIPIHPKLKPVLASLKNDSGKVFNGVHYNSGSFGEKFRSVLDKLKIRDTIEGKAGFHSFRASFITRCEEAGISRAVIQGIVGHGSPAMTELYSHDKESAKAILSLT